MKTAGGLEWGVGEYSFSLTYRLALDKIALGKRYSNRPWAALRHPCDAPQHLFWAAHCQRALKSNNLLKLNSTKQATCKLWKLPEVWGELGERVGEGVRTMAWHCLTSLFWMRLIVRWYRGSGQLIASLKLITICSQWCLKTLFCPSWYGRELWTIRAIS